MKITGREAEISGLPYMNIELFKNGVLFCVEVEGQGEFTTLKTFEVVVDVDQQEE